MSPLIWAVLVLLAGLVLLVLETFIPSGGILGLLSGLAVIGSVAMVFVYEGPVMGTLFLGLVSIALAIVIPALIKWWPSSPIGRRILNRPPAGEADATTERPANKQLAGLLGQTGFAKTKMLPSGAIVVAGRTYDAVSEGVAIEQGQAVKVVQVRANRVVVRPTSGMPTAPSEASQAPSQPIETIVPDPFDDSLP
jgi:membrane-bound serine protease (ClpP class)